MLSEELENTLQRALDKALNLKHQFITLELYLRIKMHKIFLMLVK